MTTPHHFRVILFDADGMTLIPKRFSEQIEKDYGIPWEKMKPFFSGPFQACKLGKADLKEELARALPAWGWTRSVEDLLTYWFSIGSDVNPDIAAAIKTLRSQGIKCYLATNQEKYRGHFLRTEKGLYELFDGIFMSSEFGHLKNDITFFAHAFTELQQKQPDLLKEEVLFIDHEEQNLEAARTFGYNIYSYLDAERFEKDIVGPLTQNA